VLNDLLNHYFLRNLPFLILASKQDLKESLSPEISKILKLDQIKDRKWKIEGTSLNDKQGLINCLKWLE
jgi:signal recognition particle receptor subunit beta